MGISRETCPFHPDPASSLLVNWTSAAFRCLDCGRSGGATELSAYLEEKRESDQASFLAGGGIEVRYHHQDPERGAAIEKGLHLMLGARTDEIWATEDFTLARAREHFQKVLEGYLQCGRRVAYRKFEHTHHGPSYQAIPKVPCGEYPTSPAPGITVPTKMNSADGKLTLQHTTLGQSKFWNSLLPVSPIFH